MNIQFYFLLNVILLSRLLLTFQDTPTGNRRAFVMLLIQGVGLFFYQWNLALVILAIILILIQILFVFLENRFKHLNEFRLASLLVYIVVSSIFTSPLVKLDLSTGLKDFGWFLAQYSTIGSSLLTADWLKINLLVLGLLFVSNESNILIRYLFTALELSPQTEKKKGKSYLELLDKREFNAGRIIGILERALIYFFVLRAQFEAIGLILAAKSFARFKQMDERRFAEYILIGTLISAFMALVIAELVKQLIP